MRATAHPHRTRERPAGSPGERIDPARAERRLVAGFASLVALTFALIVLGALVRAHDAGLACPDWPLCFGEAIPEMNLQVAFEWTHRVVAGTVAALFALLGGLTLALGIRRPGLRALLGVAAALLAVQIALGALTVWLKLASWTVTVHLLTGNGFAATLLLIVVALRDGNPHALVTRRARIWVAACAVLLAFQMTLGGLVSSQYAGMACPEWPTCNGGAFFPSWKGSVGVHLLHRLNGYALLGCLTVAAWVTRAESGLRRATALALALGLAQVVVGIANVLTGIAVEVTGLHSALAAGLVLTLALGLRRAFQAATVVPQTLAPR